MYNPLRNGAGGSGASTALDNLASVAINTSLISDTDNTDDLGSSAKSWKDIFAKGRIYAGDGTAALPAFTFGTETGTGLYRLSSFVGISVAGTARVAMYGGTGTSEGWNLASGVRIGFGSLTAPDAAFYRVGANILGVCASTAAGLGGFQPAQSANGANIQILSISESLTLSTSGTTTDTTANLLPANAIIHAVVARVTTTITTATSWQLGDPTTAGRFTAANATMTANTTDYGYIHRTTGVASATTGMVQTAAAKVRVTTVGTPGAGVIRITVFYSLFVAPTS